ncbi:MAG: hypothetical protein RR590_08730, partial [Hungatella sp.]
LTNLQMKRVDAKTQDSFYTAETALDEINVGLQAIAGQAAGEAYAYVLERYSLTQMQDDKRAELFQQKFLTKLMDELEQDAVVGDTYDVAELEAYLKTTKWEERRETGAKLESDRAQLEKVDGKDEAAVILKKLKIIYTDPQGYTSMIQTDIRIGVPKINFMQSISMPDLLKYTLVANDKLISAGEDVTVEGSIYGGKHGMTVSGGNFSVDDADRVITNTNLTVNDGAEVTIGADTALWAEGILVDSTGRDSDNQNSSALTLKGQTFLANDLTVLGAGNRITLENEYYGYGNPVTAKASLPNTDAELLNGVYGNKIDSELSSAMLINGKETTLDLSGLNRLLLSGNAYIGTGKLAATGGSLNAGIPTGESLAVKSNQLAYLVPQECLWLPSCGNPMSVTKYKALAAFCGERDDVGANRDKMVDFTKKVGRLNGKTLAEVGATGVKALFVPKDGTTVVYFYLTFDVPGGEPTEAAAQAMEAAAHYFQIYYKEAPNQELLDRYLNVYAESISVHPNDSGHYHRFTAGGNLMGTVSDEAESGKVSGRLIPSTTRSPEDMSALAEEEKGYHSIFFALGKKLVPNYSRLQKEEKQAEADVFGNLIDETKLTGLSGSKIFTTAVGGKKAILNGTTGTLRTGSLEEAENVRLLVTKGDVIVDRDFTGTIIAGGTIRIEGRVAILADPEETTKVLQVVDKDGDSPMNYFKEGSN